MKTKVKEFRTAAGLTQQQLAEQVHVSARTVISIEKGQYKIGRASGRERVFITV